MRLQNGNRKLVDENVAHKTLEKNSNPLWSEIPALSVEQRWQHRIYLTSTTRFIYFRCIICRYLYRYLLCSCYRSGQLCRCRDKAKFQEKKFPRGGGRRQSVKKFDTAENEPSQLHFLFNRDNVILSQFCYNIFVLNVTEPVLRTVSLNLDPYRIELPSWNTISAHWH